MRVSLPTILTVLTIITFMFDALSHIGPPSVDESLWSPQVSSYSFRREQPPPRFASAYYRPAFASSNEHTSPRPPSRVQ